MDVIDQLPPVAPTARPKTRCKRAGVPCPACSARLSDVVRTFAVGTELRRTRRCVSCGTTFRTNEASVTVSDPDAVFQTLTANARLDELYPAPPALTDLWRAVVRLALEVRTGDIEEEQDTVDGPADDEMLALLDEPRPRSE